MHAKVREIQKQNEEIMIDMIFILYGLKELANKILLNRKWRDSGEEKRETNFLRNAKAKKVINDEAEDWLVKFIFVCVHNLIYLERIKDRQLPKIRKMMLKN